jgi:hypothetical protein
MKILKLNISKLLFCVGLLFWMSGTNAQNLKITASVDTPSITIGDQVHFDINIEQPSNAVVKFPELTGKLGDTIEILEKPKIDTTHQDNLLKIHYQYLITCFDSGEYKIPALNVPYSIGAKVDTLHTNEVTFKVTNVPVDTTSQVKDIKAPLKAPVTFAEIWPYLAIGAGILFIIAGIWYLVYKRRNKDVKALAKKQEPAHIIALRELDLLRSQKLWQSEQTKKYYIQLTDIVRMYINGRFLIPAMEMTSDEIAKEFKHIHSIDQETKELLNKLFKLADLVKFAKASPLPDENEISMLNAYQFVNNTKLTEPIQAEEDIDNDENKPVNNNEGSTRIQTFDTNTNQVYVSENKGNIISTILMGCKFLGWKIRLGILLVVTVLWCSIAIPDLFFNIQRHNSSEFTINELKGLSDNNIPRYFTVKDAVVPGGAYIEESSQTKSGTKILNDILYPVSPMISGQNAEPAYIIVKDSEVKEEELQSGNYFNNASFKISGRFKGDHITPEMIKLFQDNNINIDNNAIIIEKNGIPLSFISSLLFSILGILVILLVGLSFLPKHKIKSIFVSKK